MKTLLIKLGGSIITDKSTPGSFRLQNVQDIAEILAEYRQSNPSTQIILVHGAGSFAHPFAKQYQLDGQWREETAWGLCRTELAVRKLNVMITEVMQEFHVPLFSISTSSMTLLQGEKGYEVDINLLQCSLDKNLIPTLYGDVALGIRESYQVISGDVLIKDIASKLPNISIITIGDTAGVYDKDGKTVSKINSENFEKILKSVTGSKGIDVTGGMRQKLIELMGVAEHTQSITITNLDNFPKVLRGDYTGSTQVIG
jgi:isopentenyl phosphate kinase